MRSLCVVAWEICGPIVACLVFVEVHRPVFKLGLVEVLAIGVEAIAFSGIAAISHTRVLLARHATMARRCERPESRFRTLRRALGARS